METSINLRINAGQAKSEAESVRQSVENLAESLEKLKGEGDWGGAAETIRKQQEAQVQSVQQQTMGYSTAGGAAGSVYAGAGSAAQALKSLEMRIETLTRVSEDLAQQLEKAAEGGAAQSSFNLSSTLSNVEQERRQLIAEKARLEGEDSREKEKEERGGRGFNATAALQSAMGLALQYATVNSNYRQSMAQGDYIDAYLQKNEGNANMLGTLSGMAMASGFLPLQVLGGVGQLGTTIWKMVNKDEQAQMAEAEAFQRSLEPTHGLNKLFFNGSYEENNARAKSLIGAGAEAAAGTGLDLYDFLRLTTDYASYGAKTQSEAIADTRQAALFANTTGANISGALSFLGTMRRFGDTDDALGIANYAREQTGMTKAQTDEFLSSMSRIIEEGISNGFVRSTKDVASTMRMFYRLSDESPLWQGKYGAERLSRLNSGIAGATSLSKTSDVIAYGAAQELLSDKSVEERSALLGKDAKATGTWVDYMMLLEKGMDADLFKQLAGDIAAIEGEGNVEGQIARWKDMTGVNWTMATQLYQMSQRYLAGEEVDSSEMDKLMEDYKNAPKEGNYESYLTNMQDSLNKLTSGIAVMSEADFRKMLEILHKQESTAGATPSIPEKVEEVAREGVAKIVQFNTDQATLAELERIRDKSKGSFFRGADPEGAILEYIAMPKISPYVGEAWSDILSNKQETEAQEKMRQYALDLLKEVTTAKYSFVGKSVDYSEVINSFAVLNAKGGDAVAAYNSGEDTAVKAFIDALESLKPTLEEIMKTTKSRWGEIVTVEMPE